MSYDFTTRLDRRRSGSYKWNDMLDKNPNVARGIVPLSVADMEFVNPPEIIEALHEWLDDAVLGYAAPTDEFFDAVVDWQRRRHLWPADRRFVVTTSGVVPALYTAVRSLTDINDAVICQTPVYGPFTNAVEVSGRQLLANSLRLVEDAEKSGSHRFEMDFDDLRAKAEDPSTKMLLLCNPHNPVGRAWSADELRRLLDICVENDVIVVSDEIHGDIVMPGQKHTSIMQVADAGEYDHVMVLTAPSKTFNIAGCQASVAFVPDDELRKRFSTGLKIQGVFGLNSFAYPATIAAYTRCDKWLEELNLVVWENYVFLKGFFASYMPEVEVFPLEATYLAWLDFRAWGLTAAELEQFMQTEALLFLDEGYVFGQEGAGFERINLACPRGVLEEALERLAFAARERKLGTYGGNA